jgi:hypothetical protein
MCKRRRLSVTKRYYMMGKDTRLFSIHCEYIITGVSYVLTNVVMNSKYFHSILLSSKDYSSLDPRGRPTESCRHKRKL